MELVQPGIGLIFWMTIGFGIVLWILAKFAWKPIMSGLREREDFIDEALHAADKAREEMKELKFSNEQLLKDAKEERDEILNEARKIKESIIEEAKRKANEEADRVIDNARERIENEKLAAMTDLKNQIARLSIEVAEKILQHELAEDEQHKKLINKLIGEIQLN